MNKLRTNTDEDIRKLKAYINHTNEKEIIRFDIFIELWQLVKELEQSINKEREEIGE